MTLRIALFELRYQLRQPLLWLMAFFFGLLTFGAASSDSVQIGGAIGNIDRNAPWVIVQMMGIMTSLGPLLTTVFVAGAILRDFDHKTHELFFSRPIRKWEYLMGRFGGAFFISLAAFSGSIIGMLLGYVMPWVDPEQLGAFHLSPYLYAMVVFVLPNMFFIGATFFALAGVTRSMLTTYLGVVGFFVAYFMSSVMLTDLDSQYLGALLDPFGIGALQEVTKYWTVVERNSELPPVTGVLLQNRLLWTGLALLILLWGMSRFQTTAALAGKKWRWFRRGKKASSGISVETQGPLAGVTGAAAAGGIQRVNRAFDFATAFQQFLRQARVEVASVFKGNAFLIILAFGLFNLIANANFLDQFFGTLVHPVTQVMVRAIQGGYAFLLLIIVTFYGGELIWKERSHQLDGVFDSMPVPNWVYLGAKLVAQLLVVVVFLAVGVVAMICFQIFQGYYNFELPVYFWGTLVVALPFLLTCFLSSFLQVVSGNKFIGYLLMVLFIVSTIVLSSLDFDHKLYDFGSSPNAPYSDMNGYGHFVKPLFWFNLYWALAAAVLTGLAALLWVRGTDTGWRMRLRVAGQRFRGPIRVVLPLLFLAFAATGGWIFYNTNVINEYLPSDEAEERQADYEKKYRQFIGVDLPRITDVNVDVDIFPYQRRVEARGWYRLVNRNEEPLTELHISIPERVTVNSLDFPAHEEKLHDAVHGYRIYRLQEPLAVGEAMDLRFDLTIDNPGFRNANSDTSIVHNGTFFNNVTYFPTFGYNAGAELQDRNLRRKYELPAVHRMAKVDDLEARQNTYLSNDADWINFETTVSTSADQIAIAPGYLQREWEEDGRRYFHYKMDSPILPFYAYLSARYEVVRDRWRNVDIEIYHHPDHTFNLDRMVDSVKKSLDYFSTNFGPYQHRQMRIIEFPRYASFAQAFPNTVPFSESIGFIAKLDDDEDAIDYPFYVTSHEVAHQWWAHQVIGGNVQGSTMLSETMSQYSALMVMEKEFGKEKMRRFLKYELDRYLRGRSQELVEEMPLMLVENQGYIHYRKGSLIMYALRDYVGEEALNGAIADYVEAVKFQKPPFTHTPEFLEYIRRVVPPEQEGLIADLFEHITLFENRIEEAKFTERSDGKYLVNIVAEAKKFRADGEGVETSVPIDDWIEVGVFGEEDGEERVLFLERRHLTDPQISFEVVVDQKPARVGIDPYNKLVDRNSDDNLKRVKEVSAEDLASAATAAGS